jgi:hypothetical protein
MSNLSSRLSAQERQAREQRLDEDDDGSLSCLPPHLREVERQLQAMGLPELPLPPHLQALVDQYERQG